MLALVVLLVTGAFINSEACQPAGSQCDDGDSTTVDDVCLKDACRGFGIRLVPLPTFVNGDGGIVMHASVAITRPVPRGGEVVVRMSSSTAMAEVAPSVLVFRNTSAQEVFVVQSASGFAAPAASVVVFAMVESGFDGVPSVELTLDSVLGDDSAGLLVHMDKNYTSESGTTAIVSVSLSAWSSSDVSDLTVVVSIKCGSVEISVSPTLLRFQSRTARTPQLVTLTGLDDFYVDGTRTCDLTFTPQEFGTPVTVHVFNHDDDQAGLFVSSEHLTVSELMSQAFTVSLTSVPYKEVVVRLSDAVGPFVAFPSTLVFSPSTWNLPQRVVVTGVPLGSSQVLNMTTVVVLVCEVGEEDQAYANVRSELIIHNEGVVSPVVSLISPSLSGMDGQVTYLEGTGLLEGVSVIVDGIRAEVVQLGDRAPASAAATSLRFVSPPLAIPGYKYVFVGNPNGGSTTVIDGMYYTRGCTTEGQWGGTPTCGDCPDGATCPGGPRMWPNPGYWSSDEHALWVAPCMPPAACVGGRFPECEAGYTGAYCGQCIKSFRRLGGRCVECETRAASTVLLAIDVCWYVAFACCITLLKRTAAVALVTVLMTVGVLRIVAVMLAPHVSVGVLSVLSISGVLTGESTHSHGCNGEPELFINAYWTAVGIVAGSMVATSAGGHVFRHFAKHDFRGREARKRVQDLWTQQQLGNPRNAATRAAAANAAALLLRPKRDPVRFAITSFLTCTYINMMFHHWRAIWCVRVQGTGGFLLRADPTVQCFKEKHMPVFIFALICLLLHGIGYPLFLTYRLYPLPRTRTFRYSFLLHQIRLSRRLFRAFWHILLFFLVATVVTLPTYPTLQAVVLLAHLAATAVYARISQPFKSGGHNHLLCIFLTFCFAVATLLSVLFLPAPVYLLIIVAFALVVVSVALVSLAFLCGVRLTDAVEVVDERRASLVFQAHTDHDLTSGDQSDQPISKQNDVAFALVPEPRAAFTRASASISSDLSGTELGSVRRISPEEEHEFEYDDGDSDDPRPRVISPLLGAPAANPMKSGRRKASSSVASIATICSGGGEGRRRSSSEFTQPPSIRTSFPEIPERPRLVLPSGSSVESSVSSNHPSNHPSSLSGHRGGTRSRQNSLGGSNAYRQHKLEASISSLGSLPEMQTPGGNHRTSLSSVGSSVRRGTRNASLSSVASLPLPQGSTLHASASSLGSHLHRQTSVSSVASEPSLAKIPSQSSAASTGEGEGDRTRACARGDHLKQCSLPAIALATAPLSPGRGDEFHYRTLEMGGVPATPRTAAVLSASTGNLLPSPQPLHRLSVSAEEFTVPWEGPAAHAPENSPREDHHYASMLSEDVSSEPGTPPPLRKQPSLPATLIPPRRPQRSPSRRTSSVSSPPARSESSDHEEKL